MMTFILNLQPEWLDDDITKLMPLDEHHFEALYQVASDPLIWTQHPIKDRYKKEVFQVFFDDAIRAQSSFVIIDKKSNAIIGTTRYYDCRPEKSSIAIGYTFIARQCWGGVYNLSSKKLLINYAFQHVNSIFFHIGADNLRSQKAILKLGARKTKAMMVCHNNINLPHFEYELKKTDFIF